MIPYREFFGAEYKIKVNKAVRLGVFLLPFCLRANHPPANPLPNHFQEEKTINKVSQVKHYRVLHVFERTECCLVQYFFLLFT